MNRTKRRLSPLSTSLQTSESWFNNVTGSGKIKIK